MLDMPKSRLKLPPLKLSTPETFGERLARYRKERGLTQVELARKVGLTQSLVTSYERDRLRLNAEMLCRFALALGVRGDDILGLPAAHHRSSAGHASSSASQSNGMNRPGRLSLKLTRRLQKIESLPETKQRALLQTIDAFLVAAGQRQTGSETSA